MKFDGTTGEYDYPLRWRSAVQQHDQYFQTRQGTLMDSAAWRVGNKRDIRPLYSEDQKKIEERLKPINRKDE